jgi:transcriptional regulator with XRE-family HTH domain
MPTLGDHAAAAVRAERARRRISQAELARRIGWSPSTLADLEGGRRQVRLDDLPLLCEALDVPLMKLLADADPAEIARLRLGGA